MLKVMLFSLCMSFLPYWIFSPPSNVCKEDSVSDIDGNVYKIIKVGNQLWMAENLKVSRYRNGDSIPNVTDNKNWKELTKGTWCYYGNEPANGATYGKLYNWFAVNDSRGLCPQGWRIPTNNEWQVLVEYSGGNKIAGGNLKSDTLWDKPNEAASGISGFTVLPAGFRYYRGNFSFLGQFTGLWSSSEANRDFAWLVFFDRSSKVNRIYFGKKNGFSCRCIMN